jgi:hypothetical protein
MLDQVADRQVLVRDGVMAPHEGQGHLVVEVVSLAAHGLLRFG